MSDRPRDDSGEMVTYHAKAGSRHHAARTPSRSARLRRLHRGALQRPRVCRRTGAGRDPGGVRRSTRGGIAQGRDGPDAADARHGARAGREQPVRSRGEHPRRRGLPAAAAGSLRPATWSWPWPPTTRARAASPIRDRSAVPRDTGLREEGDGQIRAASPLPLRTPPSTSGSTPSTARPSSATGTSRPKGVDQPVGRREALRASFGTERPLLTPAPVGSPPAPVGTRRAHVGTAN